MVFAIFEMNICRLSFIGFSSSGFACYDNVDDYNRLQFNYLDQPRDVIQLQETSCLVMNL